MRRNAAFALALALAACGIGVIGVPPEGTATLGAEGGATLPDGSSAPPPDGAAPIEDAGGDEDAARDVEAGPSNQCVLIEQSFNVPLDARWQLAGSAEQKNGRVELTDINAEANIGGLWLKQSLSWAKTLSVVVHYEVEESAAKGAGLAIAWVKSNPTWKVGDQGPNYGICSSGLEGVAAGLRLQSNDFLEAISGVSGICDTNGNQPGDYTHDRGALTMVLTPNNLHLASNGNMDDLAATPSLTGYVGITAATGFNTAGQSMFAITSVTIEACP